MNKIKNKKSGLAGWIQQLLKRRARSRDDILEILKQAKEQGILDEQSLVMITGALALVKKRARDIMVPRAQMRVIEMDATLEQILPIVVESAHSRFPVIEKNLDTIQGILLAKDLLPYALSEEKFDWNAVLRPAVMVPESKRLDVLLQEFRQKRYHMAIVVDEYGNTAGLITIEDILEEIVGEIEDEYDIDDEHFIKAISDHEYVINALMPIEEFNEYFHEKFSNEEFDTLGGLVMNQFGHLPKRGEKTRLGKYSIKVLQADERRIRLLLLRKK